MNGQQAGRGGDSGLESGPQQQQQAALASAAAGQLSAEQLGIQQQNTATQLQQQQQGASGLLALSASITLTEPQTRVYRPGGEAFGEAGTIAQQQAQADMGIAGLVTSAGMAALGAATGGSSGGSGGSGGGGGYDWNANEDTANIEQRRRVSSRSDLRFKGC